MYNVVCQQSACSSEMREKGRRRHVKSQQASLPMQLRVSADMRLFVHFTKSRQQPDTPHLLPGTLAIRHSPPPFPPHGKRSPRALVDTEPLVPTGLGWRRSAQLWTPRCAGDRILRNLWHLGPSTCSGRGFLPVVSRAHPCGQGSRRAAGPSLAPLCLRAPLAGGAHSVHSYLHPVLHSSLPRPWHPLSIHCHNRTGWQTTWSVTPLSTT